MIYPLVQRIFVQAELSQTTRDADVDIDVRPTGRHPSTMHKSRNELCVEHSCVGSL